MAITPRKKPYVATNVKVGPAVGSTATKQPGGTGSAGTYQSPGQPAAPVSTQISQPNPVAAAQTAAVPSLPAPAPPPPTAQSVIDRTGAHSQYETLQNSINSQLRNLAKSYGGAPKAQQFGVTYATDPTKGYEVPTFTSSQQDVTPNAPGSQLEVLARNLAAQKNQTDEQNQADNTFFSSRRLDQLGTLDKGYNSDAGKAQTDYEKAAGDLISQLTGGQGILNTNEGQFGLNDINAAMAPKPAPASDTPPPPTYLGHQAGEIAFGPGQQTVPTKQNTSVKVGNGWMIVVGPDGKPQLKKVGT